MTDQGTVPLSQMISERQDAAIINFWLNDSVRRNYKIPNECVCDDSKALHSALTRAYALCGSTMHYKQMCFRFLTNQSSELPRCFIRNDFAHFINNARKWPLWKQRTHKLVKCHFLRWLALLVQCNFADFENRLLDILTVTLAETIGRAVQKSKRNLLDLVSGIEVPNDDGEDQQAVDEPNNEEEDADTPQEIRQWLEGIVKRAKTRAAEQGDDINTYAHPDFVEKLIKICLDFVMWSGVMVECFGSPYPTGVSAHVEEYLDDLKERIFENETLPVAILHFVAAKLSSIIGYVCIVSLPLEKKK